MSARRSLGPSVAAAALAVALLGPPRAAKAEVVSVEAERRGWRDALLVGHAAADPAALVSELGRRTPEWMVWTVQAVPEARDVCCFGKNFHTRECSLAREQQGWGTNSDFHGSGPARLHLFVEVARGEPSRILLAGATCPIDGGGRQVTELEGVDVEKGLAFLEKLARAGDGDDEVGSRALAAIGYHVSEGVGRRLEQMTFDRTLGLELRKNALFWAGQSRPALGTRLADRLLGEASQDGRRDDRHGDELREQALFVLSQAGTPAAVERLRRAARGDTDRDVRSKALFWLSQLHDQNAQEAAHWIYDAIAVERDREVREQGVFALSQVDGGVDYLLRLLRDSDFADVKRQALFWLGQSDDPRALDELARLLED